MDPWISPEPEEKIVEVTSTIDLEITDSLNNPDTITFPDKSVQQKKKLNESLFFEDDFQPQPHPSTELEDKNLQPFSKLPDSVQYLESLEKKLNSVKSGGKKGSSASSILQSLSQTRESCMIKLLSNSVTKDNNSLEEFLSDDLKVNLLLKKIAPEKQAISAEELVHLLKADQLDLLLVSSSEEKEQETPQEEYKESSKSQEEQD